MRQAILAASLAALLVAACDNASEQSKAGPPGEGQENSSSDASSRAGDALRDAGNSALDAASKLGEAGKAGLEVLKEEAPAVTEKLNQAAESAKEVAGQAGQRLQSAADALLADPDGAPVDSRGDSQNDANQTPEAQEPAR